MIHSINKSTESGHYSRWYPSTILCDCIGKAVTNQNELNTGEYNRIGSLVRIAGLIEMIHHIQIKHIREEIWQQFERHISRELELTDILNCEELDILILTREVEDKHLQIQNLTNTLLNK